MFAEMSLIDLFQASPTMVVLLLCSIVTVGFVIERVLYFKASAANNQRFMQSLGESLKTGQTQQALHFCRTGKGAIARVMEQAVSQMHRTREEIQQRIDTAIEVEQVEMERNLSVLGTMSHIAPLLGLFGTVVGIIRAFADIARTGSGGSSVVAMGVSEALMTTAAGIIVAVIASVFFNVFVRKIRTRVVQLQDAREEYFAAWDRLHRAQKEQQAQRLQTLHKSGQGIAGQSAQGRPVAARSGAARPSPHPQAVEGSESEVDLEPILADILS